MRETPLCLQVWRLPTSIAMTGVLALAVSGCERPHFKRGAIDLRDKAASAYGESVATRGLVPDAPPEYEGQDEERAAKAAQAGGETPDPKAVSLYGPDAADGPSQQRSGMQAAPQEPQSAPPSDLLSPPAPPQK